MMKKTTSAQKAYITGIIAIVVLVISVLLMQFMGEENVAGEAGSSNTGGYK